MHTPLAFIGAPLPEPHEEETAAEAVARLRAKGWGPARILSGLGHPGYGAAFARQALERIERFGMTAHEAVYGGRSAALKVELARTA